MADIEITTDATVPSNTSLTVVVYEDVGGDGSGSSTDPAGNSYDNSASTSVAGGTNTYTLSGFDKSDGNDFWIEVKPSNSDVTTTPSLNSASLVLTPGTPTNVSMVVNGDDSITVSWDGVSGATQYRIEMSRDDRAYTAPSGGPTMVSDDGSASYSATFNPSSDNSYDSQVGIDSSFVFRVRAENNDGVSSWAYTSTKRTTPVAPKNPSISRPSGTEIDLTYTANSDAATRTDIEYRVDDGSGWSGWSNMETKPVASKGSTVTRSYSVANGEIQKDARYHFRIAHYVYQDSDNDGNNELWESEFVFADYGNGGNVYFSDDFESADLSSWDTTSLSDADSGVRSDGHGDLGISGAAEGSYWLRLDAEDYVQKDLGDLSGESNVMVKCYMAAGSLDSSSENWSIWWYDGSAWQELRSLHWEYNRQGWVEVTAPVPSSYLSTDNRLRLQAGSGFTAYGGDHGAFDRVVVADILDEWTHPADPSGLSLDTSVEDEITASWTINGAFWPNHGADVYTQVEYRATGVSSWNAEHAQEGDTGSETITGLDDGEEYEVRITHYWNQPRHGSLDKWFNGPYVGPVTGITVLPAPTGLTVDAVFAEQADISWSDNHDYGDTRIDYKPTSTTTWSVSGTESIGVGTHSLGGLRNGEEYDVRVVAQTEHTETVDQ